MASTRISAARGQAAVPFSGVDFSSRPQADIKRYDSIASGTQRVPSAAMQRSKLLAAGIKSAKLRNDPVCAAHNAGSGPRAAR